MFAGGWDVNSVAFFLFVGLVGFSVLGAFIATGCSLVVGSFCYCLCCLVCFCFANCGLFGW